MHDADGGRLWWQQPPLVCPSPSLCGRYSQVATLCSSPFSALLSRALARHVVLFLTRFCCVPGHANTDDQEIVISFEPTPEAIGFASLVESGRHLETTVRIVLRGGLTDETIEYHVRSAPCEVACDGVRCRCVCVRVCLCVCGPGIDWVLSWK